MKEAELRLRRKIMQHSFQKRKKDKKRDNHASLIIIAVLVALILFFMINLLGVSSHKFTGTCAACLETCHNQHLLDTSSSWSNCNAACFLEYGGMIECIKVKDEYINDQFKSR
jgi:ABC-type Fe3+ transport system permease subunit